MPFNFKLMFRLLYKSLFLSNGTNARLTPRRIALLLFLIPFFLVVELINWASLLLDEILFPRYRQIGVTKPMFIIGVPRSGTTFLHRLLARDAEQFTCMKLWEEVFAPSIIQKKFWCAVSMIDNLFGRPAYHVIRSMERKIFNQLGRMHKSSLFEPEEDEILLFHIFSTVSLSVVFPFEQDFRPFALFDQEMPLQQRERIMSFYKKCVQKHLYVFGDGKRFLSKNPLFSPKVESLYRTFPDARIICMVRTPYETIPSSMSLFSFFCHSCTSPVESYPMHDAILEMLSMWYRYPLEQLEKQSPEQQAIVKYDTLVQDSIQTVHSLYTQLGYNLTAAFQKVLHEEAERARKYKSSHSYSLEQCGLSQDRIREDYRDILDRFGFEPLQETQTVAV